MMDGTEGYLRTRGLKAVRMVLKVISAPEVSVSTIAAQWTRVTSPLVGHRNICKLQRTVMTP
jgi:hypothetical protein